MKVHMRRVGLIIELQFEFATSSDFCCQFFTNIFSKCSCNC
jgi:hypothetical protein